VTLHLPGGQLLKGVNYTNKNTAENPAGSETVTIKATVNGIHSTCTGEFCLLVGGETLTEGTYVDDVFVTGYEDIGGFTQQ
jgi:phosphoribosylaminoimidazole (AIR) synthetase